MDLYFPARLRCVVFVGQPALRHCLYFECVRLGAVRGGAFRTPPIIMADHRL
jgi:hypothetical protein